MSVKDEFFNGSKFNQISDEQPQFIRVPIQNSELGARKSITGQIGTPNDAIDLSFIPNEM